MRAALTFREGGASSPGCDSSPAFVIEGALNPKLVEKLEALNETFYMRHAVTFSHTRTAPWPGWKRVDVDAKASVLDLGCGNGRYLDFLRSRGFEGAYHGVDSCSSLVERAAEMAPPSEQVRWSVNGLNDVLSEEQEYDHVAAWGLLHHVASEERRAELIGKMLQRTKTGGSLWLSLWQFRKHERFRKHECDPSAFGLSRSELEEGDALLDWQGDRDVPRYCHHFSDEEVKRISQRFADATPSVHRQEAASDRFNVYLHMRRLGTLSQSPSET